MLIRKISGHSQLETPHWLQRKLAATLCASIGLAIFYICPEAIGEEPAEVIFARKVLPLFKTRCLACHGEKPEKLKGEFDLRSRAGLLSGGESEKPAVVAGKPLESPLYLAVTREYEDDWKSMPPKKNDKLSDQEVKYIRDWITGGAPWPDEKRLAELLAQKDPWATEGRITVKTSGGLSSEWTNREYDPEGLWAYQPLKRPKVPKEGANPIDAFIDARLPEGLKAAPQADPATLIRRAAYNLTGLPPSPKEVDDFRAAWKKDPGEARKALVERLLESPHYGEQMARHWLDVVRYADSAGFSNDYPRPHAWRYRDYVIRSFNADKPYDQFIREQLAGDELKPGDPDHLIATGFLRMGPWEHTAMSVAIVTRQQYLDDVVNSIGVTFLGNELRCAKCHDHKFDPIPTKDYYRIQAIFATVQFAHRRVPYQPQENRRGLSAGKTRYEKLAKEQSIRSLLSIPEKERPVRDFDRDTEKKGHNKVRHKRTQQLQHELTRYRPLAFSVYSGPDIARNSQQAIHWMPPENKRKNAKAPEVRILTGGSLETPGEPVKPGVLSFLSGSEEGSAVTDATGGRRAKLANWIASKKNPLTARVIVNRVWQWRFGRALAANPNNFGSKGARPSHPQLLDWLASEFISGGWSFKKLDRLILSSTAWQRAAAHPDPAKLGELDPKGTSYAAFPPRRLGAEELRDAMLAISGELNRELGGIPVHPEINEEVAMQPRHIMGSVGPAYQADPLPGQRNRRTIYAERIRTLADPLLEVFNKPGPDLSCERRDSSTIVPQAFTLLNSPIVRARALALAARIEKEKPGNLRAQVVLAFRLIYQRTPAGDELQRCLAHLEQTTRSHEAIRPVKKEKPKYVIRQMVEEMTGLDFWWVEDLDIYAGDYVADLQPWDVKPPTRALADLCLVLFNSNEFVYIY
ncbi:MAG: hypothetical protein CMJ99_09420 [Planctomycetes bacterium]|nr:hypothetical protein [Planctomycetota bacterium]